MFKNLIKTKGFSPKKQDVIGKSSQNHEAGSVIVWILAMVAIFAALNYAISAGSRSGGAKISQEQARLAANDIIQYASTLKNAVQTLQINGCQDTEVSFDQAIISGYSNINAPTDQSCHIFKPNGGGLTYQRPDTDWLDSTKSALNFYGTLHTTSSLYVAGLGVDGAGANCAGASDDCRELITGIPYIKEDICKAINKKLGTGVDNDGTPYTDTGVSYGASTNNQFTGSYATSGDTMGAATPSNYTNMMAGCIAGDTNPASGSYSFFQVLIVR